MGITQLVVLSIRCKQAENENYDTFNLVYNKRNDCSLLSISDCWIYR